jgi:hypothetical protein
MAKKALTGLSAAMLGGEESPPPAALETPAARPVAKPAPSTSSKADEIALTLKVPPAIYERLKILGARRRLTNQAVLSAALTEYLDREENR